MLDARVQEQTRGGGEADWFIGELASPVTRILGIYECLREEAAVARKQRVRKPSGPIERKRPKRKASGSRRGSEARRRPIAKSRESPSVLESEARERRSVRRVEQRCPAVCRG